MTAGEGAVGGRDHLFHSGWRRSLQLRLLLTDLVLITVALTIASWLRFGETPGQVQTGFQSFSYAEASALFAAGWIGLLALHSCYSMNVVGVGSEEYRNIARATLTLFGGIAIFIVLTKGYIARAFLAYTLPIGLTLLVLGRLFHRLQLLRKRRRGVWMEPALVVGTAVEVRHVVDSIRQTPLAGYQVVGVATGSSGKHFALGDGVLVAEVGDPEHAASAAAGIGATTVIVAGQSQRSPMFIRQLGWDLEESNSNLVLASRMTDVAGPRIHWRPIEGLPLISVEMPRYSGVKYIAKRAFDVIFGIILLVLVSPFLISTAIAIWLEDRGPVFYRQRRVGVKGTTFTMHKFRSMVVDAEAKLAQLREQHDGNTVLFKMKDDPRVTRVGKFIRRYSIDELPQLIDVVRGKMSLVGPRPPLPDEVNSYEQHVHRRLYVKPGITGPWQVGGRSNLSWEESVRKDLYYVENWSMTGDLLILLKTIKAVVSKDGAY